MDSTTWTGTARCVSWQALHKRGAVVSKFYNQTSVLHTMSRMFGIPPMNQMVALSPIMTDCFTSKADFQPYKCLPNQIPLDEMNKATAQLQGDELHWRSRAWNSPSKRSIKRTKTRSTASSGTRSKAWMRLIQRNWPAPTAKACASSD